MKIRHLLLGLMICVAGTGAIDLSGGFLDDQNKTQLTPFLIFGHVWYEEDAPCNSPNVSITNLNSGAAWYADTVSGSNFYQTLLTLADVGAGDLLEFDVTDGVGFNSTNHTVGLGDIESGGIFGFDIILQSIAPGIIGYAPESPVYDIENATRRFHITIDQVVDVAWRINGSPIHTNGSVTDASCTYTVGIGVWNISANASNENGTVMQTWTWNVTALSPPKITSFTPPSPVRDTDNATRTFGIKVDQVVDVTWLINGTEVFDEADVNESSYTNTSAALGVWNVTAVVSNQNGTDAQEWTWYVTLYTPPPSPIFVICGEVFYEDNMPVYAPCVVVTNLNTSREFIADNRSGENFYQIITDASEIQTGDLLMINASKDGVLVGNGSVQHIVTLNESRSGAICVNINRGWADLRVVEISTPPYIFDNVTNTINATVANNGTTGSDGFNVSLDVDGCAIGSAHIGSLGVGCAADVAFDWMPDRIGAHVLTLTADSDGEIDESNEANNATSMDVFVGVPDFAVTDMSIAGYVLDPLDPEDTKPVFEYPNNVTVTIANKGDLSDDIRVEFYSELNMSGECVVARSLDGFQNTSNDTITQPNASRMRVHFWYLSSGANSHLALHGRDDNTVETLTTLPADGWSEWMNGDTIKMCASVGATSGYVWFGVDRYEYLFAHVTTTLAANESMDVSGIWYADPAIVTNETQSGYVMLPSYTISAVADPDGAVAELNESNNACEMPVDLWYPYDFMVTEVTCSPERPREGEMVTIDATVRNIGFRGIGTDVAFYADGDFIAEERVYLDANGTEQVSAVWDALPDISHLTEEHEITVVVDPNGEIDEWADDNNALPQLLNITLANLTVTEITTDPAQMIIGDPVDVIATIRNNEFVTTNSTVWFCEENDSVSRCYTNYDPDSHKVERNELITHKDALMMRAYCTINTSLNNRGNAQVYLNGRQVLTCTSGPYSWSGWTNWTSGSTTAVNISIYANVPDDDYSIRYNISKYQTVFGAAAVTIPASKSVNLSMNWTVIQKNPELIIATSNATNSTDVFVSGTDLAVTNVSVSDYLVWDGDSVNLTAEVVNFGRIAASNFTVEFYDSYYLPRVPELYLSLITTKSVPSLAAGDSENITVPWTASLKIGDDILCYHWIKAEVIPQDSHIEDNSTNNTGCLDVIMIKRSRDFSVTDITFFTGNETIDPPNLRMGEPTTINATVEVTNLASCGGSVNVSWYLDNNATPIDNTTVSFPAGNGTVHAKFVWDVDVYGNHTITVIADPENKTSEFDESNNASGQLTYIRAPDLVVTNLSFDPERLEEGDIVNITTTVINCGDLDADNVNLTIYDCTDAAYYEYGTPYRRTPGQTVTMGDATAMRLYTKLQLWDGSLRFYDCQNQLIASYNASFNGQIVRTPWAFGNYITVEHEGAGWGDMWVYGIEYTTVRDTITTTNLTLVAGGAASIAVNRSTSLPGEHQVFAIIDPENRVWESDESNNEFARTLIVRGADLTVSDMRVAVNETAINGTGTVITAGDLVTISAIVTNIGIRHARNFSVSFRADGIDDTDDAEIASKTNMSLNIGESVNVSAEWNATIGDYIIAVYADSEDGICETNESNNTRTMDIVVRGADLNVTGVRCIVLPPNNATTNETGSGFYDTDTVLINATVANQGMLPADNFSTHTFYEVIGLEGFDKLKDVGGCSGWTWINRTFHGSGCMYVWIQDSVNIKNNLKIYDRNDDVAASPDGDGWFVVDGDEANVHFHGVHGVGVNMSVYAGEVQRYHALYIETGESENLIMAEQVTTGDHAVRVFVDPENRVAENSEENNYADVMLTVHPSRDFTVSDLLLSCSYNGSLIGVNGTVIDGDFVVVNTTIGMGVNDSDPYREYRKGDADVAIIDRHEWVNVSPRYELTPYGYAQVITCQGADAMRVHFEEMSLPQSGCIEIRDTNWTVQWSCSWIDGATENSSWVEGETVYIYRVERPGSYNYVWGRITFSIDRYQYRLSNRTTVPIGAGETRNVTAKWDGGAGNHTIRAKIDPDDSVGEINESNNEICRSFHIEPCKDPAVLNITFDPQEPAVGSDVLVNARIANMGSRTVTFTVDLMAEKTEYHPFESPHDDDDDNDDFPYRDYEWEIPSTYPDADWMGLHFARINMSRELKGTLLKRDLYLRDRNQTITDNFCGSDETHVWAWVNGDVAELRTTACAMFPDFPVPVWGFNITQHRYRIILNRTTLTLGANKSANVTGVLRNVRAGNRSMNYTVLASLDVDNAVCEIDESNNEIARSLNISVPDFTAEISKPTGDRGISAVFKNRGFGSADARVVFARDVDYPIHKSGSWFTRVPRRPIEDDIDWTRIHFKELTLRTGGFVEVGGKRYSRGGSDFWSPWIEADRVKMLYLRASFDIDRYEFAEEEMIDSLGAGGEVRLDSPWEEYAEPYNLTVWIDPFDCVLEGNEDDNNDTVFVYTDLIADRIEFVSPEEDMLSLDADTFVIDGHITNGGGDRDDIVFPVSDFDVTLEVRNNDPNGNDTVGESIFSMTTHIDEPFDPGQDKVHKVRFEFDPNEKFDAGGNYTVSLVVDSTGVVCESDEENNATSVEVLVHNSSGYTGGGDLINVAQGEVHGRMVYTVGDSKYGGLVGPGEGRTVRYAEIIPAGAGNIELARLFVYWFTAHDDPERPGYHIPEIADVDTRFKGHSLNKVGNYSDNPGLGDYDLGYGLHCYDVKDYIVGGENGENEATVTNNADWDMGVHAIGLLVVYEDDDEPLTKYWVNEGADIMMAANMIHPTGLPSGDCITTARFDDIKRTDTEDVDATLLTVMGMYVSYGRKYLASNEGDSLELNGRSVGSLMDTGHWGRYMDSSVALTESQWEDVTDHLKSGDNLAEIHSTGNYMLANNAFLRLIFPPDMSVINLTAPSSTVVGAHHTINVTIRNDGRSDAHDFNVTFYIDGKQMVRRPGYDLPAGENMTIDLNYTWTPMLLSHVYNLTASADVLSGADWTEVETENNALTKYVTIEEGGFGNQTGPRGIGGGSNPTGGEYTEKITGRVMQGMKEFLSGGGGGGAGMFSLTEWVMKGAVWFVLVLFVYAGYRVEQRSYARVRGVGSMW